MGERLPAIPIPSGGFKTNEAEAKWLEDTMIMRINELLNLAGVNASVKPTGLYDLFLLTLDDASRRGLANKETPNAN